jgi:hypothetical protein
LNFYTYVYHTLADASIPTYVGKGKGGRYKAHRDANTHFGNHVRKQLRDDIFPITVKFKQPSEDDAFAEEKRLIALYGRKDLGSGSLYNKTDGGEGNSGRVISPEHRAKLAMAQRLRKERLPMSKHTKALLSAAGKARNRDSFRGPGGIPRPCTVDGVTIYPSFKALVQALGQGKAGTRSPTFKYVGDKDGLS